MQSRIPPWAMGLANMPLGFYYGFITTLMPLVLRSRCITTGEIATISAIAFSPTWWVFLLSPLLDVRFTKREYCVGLFSFAALCLGAAVLLLDHLVLFTGVLTLGCAAAAQGGNALGALLVEACDEGYYGRIGGWYNVANLGAAGVFGSAAVIMLRHTSVYLTALATVLVMLAPLILFAYFPALPRPVRNASGMFLARFKDLGRILGRRECILGLVAFLAPGSAFALTNLFSGLGPDYHAPESIVAWVGGAGVALACSMGCVAGGPLADRFSRAYVYVMTGIVGAAVSSVMLFAPRTLTIFVCGVLTYNFAQGLNYAAFSGLTFELTGKKNPLAGTQVALLTASANLPISYMTWLDGRGSAHWGLKGMYAVDAIPSFIACAALLLLFRWARQKKMIEQAA